MNTDVAAFVTAPTAGTPAAPSRRLAAVTDGARAAERRAKDRELIEAVVRGDGAAMRQLVSEHERPVFALISRTLGRRADRALVEDLAQETFLRVFRALPRFDPDGSAQLSTWVLRIATNLAIDELRRRRPQLDVLPPADRVPSTSGQAEADGLLVRQRLIARVEAALAELKPEFRAAFVLREFHGLEYREIATVLEVDLGTVKSRISRAKRRLRAALEELDHVG